MQFKETRLLAGILLVILSFGINAQDEWESRGPEGVSTEHVAFDVSGTEDVLLMAAVWDAWSTPISTPLWVPHNLNILNVPQFIVADPNVAGAFYVDGEQEIIHVVPGAEPVEIAVGDYFNDFWISPDSNTIYVAGLNKFQYSNDGGSTFTEGNLTYPDLALIDDFRVDPNNSNTLYQMFWFDDPGIYKSVDGGASWTGFPTDSTSPRGLAIDPTDSTHIMVIGNDGTWRSTDGGANWAKMSSQTGTKIAFTNDGTTVISGSSFGTVKSSADFGATWTDITPIGEDFRSVNLSHIETHPTDASTMALATSHGVFLTEDAGSNWSLIDSGIRNTAAMSIDRNPITGRLLLGTGGHGIFLSDDDGVSWAHLTGGSLGQADESLAVAIDPNDDARLLSGASRDASFIVASGNGGASFSGRVSIRPQDFQFFGDAMEVLAGSDQGVYYSADSGDTWTEKNGDLPASTQVFSVDASVDETTRWFAASMYDGLFVSADAGTTWENVVATRVDAVTVAPGNSSIVYAGGQSELHRSADGGATWETVAVDGPEFLSTLLVHPDDADIVFTITLFGDAYLSLDRGNTWESITEADLGIVNDAVLETGDQTRLWVASDRDQLNLTVVAAKPGFTSIAKSATDIIENQQSLSRFDVTWSDLSVDVPNSSSTTNNTVTLNIPVNSVGGLGAKGLVMTLTPSDGMSISNFSSTAWSCTSNSSSGAVTCELDALVADTTVDLSVDVSSDTDTTHSLDVALDARISGAVTLTNSGTTSVTFKAASTPPPSTGGGGGGGGGSLTWMLIGLAGFLGMRRRYRIS